jgi:hypothetical protein
MRFTDRLFIAKQILFFTGFMAVYAKSLQPVRDYVIKNAEVYSAPPPPEPVCENLDDD